jgi:hypothetical protein
MLLVGGESEALYLTALGTPRRSNGSGAAAALCLGRQPEERGGFTDGYEGGKVQGFEIH